MTKRSCLALFASSVVAGCANWRATWKVDELGPVAHTFNSPKAEVWPLLVSEIGLKYPIKAIDASSGLIETDYLAVDHLSKIAELARHEPLFSPFSGRVSISALLVDEGPGGSRAQITLHCGLSHPLFGEGVYEVSRSRGIVESNILEAVAAKLGNDSNRH